MPGWLRTRVTPELSDGETILAFDFGLRRIGVAVGQDITASASPLGVIANREGQVDHPRIGALMAEWHATRLVVGLPLHADGSPSDMQAAVTAFIDELARYELPVSTVDERYTSIEAEAMLREARAAGSIGRISRDMIDSAAAVFIAERYLANVS